MSFFDKFFRQNSKISNNSIFSDEMLCPDCKNPINQDMAFCSGCGRALKTGNSDTGANKFVSNSKRRRFHTKFCRYCGISFDEELEFCPRCGVHVITPDYTIEIEGTNATEVKEVLAHYEELNQAKVRTTMENKAKEMDTLGGNMSKKQTADILKEFARNKFDDMSEITQNGYIFISYAHRDTDVVFPVLTQFKEHGYRIWFDESIEPASTWDDNIAVHIEQATFFISLISKSYLESKNCLQELRYSLEKKNENNQFLIYMEPVELPKGIAMRTSGVQNIMLYSYESVNDLFVQIRKIYGIEKCMVDSQLREISLDYNKIQFPSYINKEGQICQDLKQFLTEQFLIRDVENKMMVVFGNPSTGKNLIVQWLTNTSDNNCRTVHKWDIGKGERWFPSKGAIYEKIVRKMDLYTQKELSNSLLIIEHFENSYIPDEERRVDILNRIDVLFFRFLQNDNIRIIVTCDNSYINDKSKLGCDYLILSSVFDTI